MGSVSEKVLNADIVSEQEDGCCAKLVLRVPESLHYFDGHFDEAEILPGVVQVDWAVKLAKLRFPIVGEFKGLEVIKFQQVIVPESLVELELRFDQSANKLYFGYRLQGKSVSSGRVVFGDLSGDV